jgi:hypothetical protein
MISQFAKILGKRRIDRQARILSRVCAVSDNFRKVENARFRVAFVYQPSLDDTAEVK